MEFFKNIKTFPCEFIHLKSQILKSIGSVGHNIAEDFGRGSFKENIHFCRIARASLTESRDQLYAAFNFGLISVQIFNELYKMNDDLDRNINGYIGFLSQQMVKYAK